MSQSVCLSERWAARLDHVSVDRKYLKGAVNRAVSLELVEFRSSRDAIISQDGLPAAIVADFFQAEIMLPDLCQFIRDLLKQRQVQVHESVRAIRLKEPTLSEEDGLIRVGALLAAMGVKLPGDGVVAVGTASEAPYLSRPWLYKVEAALEKDSIRRQFIQRAIPMYKIDTVLELMVYLLEGERFVSLIFQHSSMLHHLTDLGITFSDPVGSITPKHQTTILLNLRQRYPDKDDTWLRRLAGALLLVIGAKARDDTLVPLTPTANDEWEGFGENPACEDWGGDPNENPSHDEEGAVPPFLCFGPYAALYSIHVLKCLCHLVRTLALF